MVKRIRNLLSNHTPEILIGFGLFFLTLSFTHNLVRLRSLRIDEETVKSLLAEPAQQVAAPNYPVHIEIPWYVDVAISPQIYQNGSWTISPSTASYLTASALPTEPGNIIIYGHNKREILGNIRALKGGESIKLTLTDGSTRTYRVMQFSTVSPTDTRLLMPTTKETLTIYTCAGIFDSQRFVVRAQVVDPPAAL